jgi:VIT1/CCC1 family predicted Fe2+/Mn2+ transporter
VAETAIVVTAGLAEVAAGSIAMGLGGYLAARSDAEHYASELARERQEIREKADAEADEVVQILQTYGLSAEESGRVMDGLRTRPEAWVNFMMRFELGLEAPDPRRALRSALTIAGSYIGGGLIPLAPYIVFSDVQTALPASVVITLLALIIFGYIKGRFTGARPLRSAIQTALIGGIAAAAAFAIARAIG